MQLKNLISLALAGAAAAVPLATVLSQNNDTLSTLNSLLATVPQLVQSLSTANGITILAPSNTAFEKLRTSNPTLFGMASNPVALTPLLQYHVVMGMMMSTVFTNTPHFATTLLTAPFANVTGGQRVELTLMNGMPMIFSGLKQMSMVTKADIMFDGGVIHVVDTVLTVPVNPAVTAMDTGLTSLAGALVKAGLVAGVDSMKDLTIFAPSNKAFEAIGSVVEPLSMQQLSSVLTYHVLGSVKFSTDLIMNGMSMQFPTLNGGSITVRMENGAVFVNSAKVTIADIITSNGVVHVIDNVLNPAATTLTPNPSAQTQAPAFSGASSAANAPFTSGIVPTTTVIPAGATNTPNAGAHGAMPTAAVMGLIGGAALLANL